MNQLKTGRLISDEAEIARIAAAAKRVAVLGIKTEQQSDQPAFYVPQYLQQAGVELVPVPVYYPNVTHILGRPVARRIADVEGELDIVDVFRRPEDLPAHLADIVTKKPRLVWLQSGIRHPTFAAALVEAGIDVVQDRCLMVEHRRGTAR